jgi:hypothetical protein
MQSYSITDDNEHVMSATHGKRGVRVDLVLSRRLLNQE